MCAFYHKQDEVRGQERNQEIRQPWPKESCPAGLKSKCFFADAAGLIGLP
jgi:hypothetical protein